MELIGDNSLKMYTLTSVVPLLVPGHKMHCVGPDSEECQPKP